MIALETIAREILNFFEAKSTLTIVALIFADLLTGVVAAIRARRFDWRKIGDFYFNNVVPYVIGYCGLYVFTGIGLDQYMPISVVDTLQPITSTPALAALAGSILDNVQRSRFRPVDPLADLDGGAHSSNETEGVPLA